MPEKDTTRSHFDGQARAYYQNNYEAPHSRHAHNLALRREACLRLFPDPQGTVLDLGCGPGAMTIPLLAVGHRVVWTDISREMVLETTRRAAALGVSANGAVADATALPFASHAFASVITTGVLEYISDAPAALAEIARVLVPNGTLIATMSLPRSFERFTVKILASLRGTRTIVKQFIHGRAAFDAMIESVGFKIDARRCCTFAPFPLDAVFPSSVPWIDRVLGDSLNRSDFACDAAKTYIVRAQCS